MKKILLLNVFLLTIIFCYGQPGPPPPDPGEPVPLTGLEVLLGAGAIYGARKLLAKNRAKQ